MLAAKGYDDLGYAKNLRRKIKIATPILINLKKQVEQYFEAHIFESGLESGLEDYEYV